MGSDEGLGRRRWSVSGNTIVFARVSTLVCFHAHPDDEALSTGGLMARAASAGHRVVIVAATRGEQGEPQPGVLADGELLWQRRVDELAESARVLGAEEPRFLGYEDSGMMGELTNNNEACFWQADVAEAAQKLAAILVDVDADVLTIYDDHGLYGHPDHIQVHRVGLAAAELCELTAVYEATVNRDRAQESFAEMSAHMEQELEGDGHLDQDNTPTADELESFGLPASELAYAVDVTDQLEAKRASMVAHRSQIADDSFFLALPPEIFAKMFGIEWFAIPESLRQDSFHQQHQPGGVPNLTFVDLLPGLDPTA